MSGIAYYNTVSSETISSAQLGQEVNIKGATYKYVLASSAITAFQACITSNTGTIQPVTTALATNVVADIVIPQFALASGEYGWAPVGPFFLREDDVTPFYVSALTLSALNVIQYTTATAGSVDDTATVQIRGLKLTSTVGGATANTPCIAVDRLVVNA